MGRYLLFCIAEEAKSVVSRVSRADWDPSVHPPSHTSYCWLVQSHTIPVAGDDFKDNLNDDEIFDTEWIGASEEECQEWALEKQSLVNFIEQNLIIIVDARTAKDDTILIKSYAPEIEGLEPIEFEPWGILPPTRDTWYSFRVPYKHALEVVSSLKWVAPDVSWPCYYGCKEQLTDVHGVFDVQRAKAMMESGSFDVALILEASS